MCKALWQYHRSGHHRPSHRTSADFITASRYWVMFIFLVLVSVTHAYGQVSKSTSDTITAQRSNDENRPLTDSLSPERDSLAATTKVHRIPDTLAPVPTDTLGTLSADSLSPRGTTASDTLRALPSYVEVDTVPFDTIKMYRYYKALRTADTTVWDTTLSIQNLYRYNHLNKDLFGTFRFANMGQGQQQLVYDGSFSFVPKMGFRMKHHSYKAVNDVNFYKVISPVVEVRYISGMEKGQSVDVLYSINLIENLNFSANYKGLRSVGKYNRSLSEFTRWHFSMNYPGDTYGFFAHYRFQTLDNQENGGLSDFQQFTSGEEEFLDRPRVLVNLLGTSSLLLSDQVSFQHYYNLLKKSTSNIRLTHSFFYETKSRLFTESNSNQDYHQSESIEERTSDSVAIEEIDNRLAIEYESDILDIEAGMRYNHRTYGNENTMLYLPSSTEGETDTVGFVQIFDVLHLFANAEVALPLDTKWRVGGGYNLNGLFYPRVFRIHTSFAKDQWGGLQIEYHHQSPMLSLQTHRSNYLTHHYKHDWDEIETIDVKLNIDYYDDHTLEAGYQRIKNYTYFGTDGLPAQHSEPINWIYAEMKNALVFPLNDMISGWAGNIRFDNRIRTQHVISSDSPLYLPTIVMRQSLYYDVDIKFDSHLGVQMGVNHRFFSSYFAQNYSPLINDYTLQEQVSIGNFPVFDAFLNLKILTMKIYLIAENFTANLFETNIFRYNYWAALGYPHTDCQIRVGVHWNFFD